ncbi:hypothetical protein [Longispora albida]|uniref:hypothetical protein n=1 Tax=Longispora albida TaxID=203523 RepID=UPI0003A7F3D7|nr:hypothetical protein [Longispora albida]
MTDDGELSRLELRRATVALGAFVRRWNLPLNPEDADEVAYALLLHARSAHTDPEIVAAVEAQIEEYEERARRLRDAMQASIERRKS